MRLSNAARRSITACSAAQMDNQRAFAAFEPTPVLASSERLRAARFLAKHATKAHRHRLSKIREAERNSWVRQALDQALKRSENGSAVSEIAAIKELQETPLDARLHEELRAQAIEETTALFLHELRPLVGLLDDAADGEVHCYARSRTKASVGRVRSFLDAIERLRMASAAPAIQEFDLTDLVVRVAADEARPGRATLDDVKEGAREDTSLDDDDEQAPQPVAKLSLARQDPVVTTGDPALVEMAVANALRNAIDAVLEVREGDREDIILNWGVTDTDSWIVVLDEGCGLPQGWERLAEPGTSTKSKTQGHLGMGLPIAQRAIESMRGSFQLTPRSGAGVSCEIRWPRGRYG